MATLQERIREYLGSQADTPAARSIAQQAEAGYSEALGKALNEPAMAGAGIVGGRGASTPAEREYLNSVMNQTRQGPGANVPRVDTPVERDAMIAGLAGGAAAGIPEFKGPAPDLDRQRRISEAFRGGMSAGGAAGATMPPMATPMPAAPTPGGMAQPTAPANMGAMTPEELPNYFQSFDKAGINLTPGAGIARGLRGIDQAITNATTAPGNLGVNQLKNIASGQSNVSPYGLGLGQQMYMNPMGLLNY